MAWLMTRNLKVPRWIALLVMNFKKIGNLVELEVNGQAYVDR
jgi:hypothetical protein